MEERGKNGHRRTRWEAILEAKVSRKENLDKVERWTGKEVSASRATEVVGGRDLVRLGYGPEGLGKTPSFCIAPPF